jgi:hypothetical protein
MVSVLEADGRGVGRNIHERDAKLTRSTHLIFCLNDFQLAISHLGNTFRSINTVFGGMGSRIAPSLTARYRQSTRSYNRALHDMAVDNRTLWVIEKFIPWAYHRDEVSRPVVGIPHQRSIDWDDTESRLRALLTTCRMKSIMACNLVGRWQRENSAASWGCKSQAPFVSV